MRAVFFSLLLFTLYSNSMYSQRVSISSNLLNYINYGTLNAEVGIGVSQHFSLYIQGKYNPFEFKNSGKAEQINNKQIAISVGGRYWPWHYNSGWFFLGQMGFVQYNRGGITSEATYEGDAYGVTLGAGYSLMLNRHFNIDFGAGLMGGFADYIKYACPSCGKVIDKGEKLFIAPNNILVQLSYLF